MPDIEIPRGQNWDRVANGGTRKLNPPGGTDLRTHENSGIDRREGSTRIFDRTPDGYTIDPNTGERSLAADFQSPEKIETRRVSGASEIPGKDFGLRAGLKVDPETGRPKNEYAARSKGYEDANVEDAEQRSTYNPSGENETSGAELSGAGGVGDRDRDRDAGDESSPDEEERDEEEPDQPVDLDDPQDSSEQEVLDMDREALEEEADNLGISYGSHWRDDTLRKHIIAERRRNN